MQKTDRSEYAQFSKNRLSVKPQPEQNLEDSVAALLLRTAHSFPDAVALSGGSESLRWGDFVARSQRLASYLISLGAEPEIPIALCIERSVDFVVSAFAVLLTGAPYLPLDPAWPGARLRKILDAAGAPLVITRGSLRTRIGESAAKMIDLEAAASDIKICEPLAAPVEITPETLAYIIYTSGSTGEPKGVEVTHGNLQHLMSWHRAAFGIQAGDRASQVAGVGFDAAVWEIWPNLAAGASVVLADEQTRSSPALLRDWLVQQRVTIAFVPTMLAEQMLGMRWPEETALRYLLTGGEALHRHPPAGLPFTVVNNYGPTECTVVATSGMVAPGGSSDLPPSIGKPIARTQVRILDSAGRPVGRGQVGEMFIAGAGVARGYRNDGAATAERFLRDPADAGSRMYRTGDLACSLEDGQILFRGRVDSQEQIHGHRVEPDEIVCALNRHSSIAASAVMARGQACAKSLVAYVVPREGASMPPASELREFLSVTLPHYMIPSGYVQIAALPFNANGKLDRDALPEPGGENRIPNSSYRAPSTPTEERLAEILTAVLGLERVGADDNFFLLGFHSLVATQVAVRVSECFGIQLSLRHMFEAPTIARLAGEVDRQLVEKLNSMSDQEVSQFLAG